jgi:hypothetical protein
MINAEAQRRGDAEIALKLLIALDLTQKGCIFSIDLLSLPTYEWATDRSTAS